MRKSILISVVIPVYNSGISAIEAFKSVLKQSSEFNYEVIFVDDCSKDNSYEYLKSNIKTKDNVKTIFIKHEHNKGAGSARKTALNILSGHYFAFLDSDDLWQEDKINIQVQYLQENSEVAMVGCLTNMPGSFVPPGLFRKEIYNITVLMQCFKNYFQTSTVLIDTKKFRNVCDWSEMRYGDEGDAFIRLAANYRVALLNLKLVNYSGGKRGFGYSGVSSNLKGMQSAELINLKMAYDKNYINYFWYIIVVLFSNLKYALRILRTKFKI